MDALKQTLKDSKVARWLIMILVSLLMAANYFFYDVLSPLKSILQEHLNFGRLWPDCGILCFSQYISFNGHPWRTYP
jgi:hypothetical protein